MTIASDIEEPILTALNTVFTTELITNVGGYPGADPLALKTLKPAPLQDDPTLTAPYLVYGPDPDKGFRLVKHGEEEREYGLIEIGGPLRFVRYYTATCGTPFATTRETAYGQIAELTTRVVQALVKYFDLASVNTPGELTSADYTRRIEGANPLLIDEATTKIKGGEQTWFGEGTVCWHYPVSWYEQYRVYTGS